MAHSLRKAQGHWASTLKFLWLVAAAAVLLMASRADAIGYETPNPAYDAPSTYYDNTFLPGNSIRTNLHNIITTGFVGFSYGDSRFILDDLWRDPDPLHPNNVILVYNSESVNGLWDSGVTWNREHLWPQSKLGVSVSNSYVGPASDLFELAPCKPSINGSRGNDAYGTANQTGNWANNGPSFFPSDDDKGDAARTVFYMATRYYNGTGTPSIQNLSLVNGTSIATYQMGDLQALLKWHYLDGVDNFERRKNDLNYDSYQKNRNPYIDHPEYVWAVWGDHLDSGVIVNNSQITVGTPNADGSSSAGVNLGSVIVGASFPTSNVALGKTGADPTTFDVTAAGGALTTAGAGLVVAGRGQAIDYGTVNKTITAGLTAPGVAGLATGTLTVKNTDLTVADNPGQGADDHDDVITITGNVLDHANASFAGGGDQNTLTINFGEFSLGSGVQHEDFDLFNLIAAPGYTSPLDLTSFGAAGHTSVLTTDLVTLDNLAAGANHNFTASFDTSSAGVFSATYTLNSSDDTVLAGATAGTQLVLTLTGSVISGISGDFDDDGDVDAADVDILWHIVRGTGTDPNSNDTADLDGNSLVNEDDVDLELAAKLTAGTGRKYGDADLDGDVDGSDLEVWRTRPGYTGPGTGQWTVGDFDGDGDVDGSDFELWRIRPTAFPSDVGAHGDGPQFVPEPSSLLLAALGLAGLIAGGKLRPRRDSVHA